MGRGWRVHSNIVYIERGMSSNRKLSTRRSNDAPTPRQQLIPNMYQNLYQMKPGRIQSPIERVLLTLQIISNHNHTNISSDTHHLPIRPLIPQQLLMTPLLDDPRPITTPTLPKDKYRIRLLNRSQSMRDRHNRHTPFRSQALHCRLHDLLRLRVKTRCRFIKQKKRWLAQQCSSNTHALTLSSTHGRLSLDPKISGVSIREGGDEVVDFCVLARLDQIVLGIFGFVQSKGDVIADSAFEESGFLCYEGYGAAVV